MDQLNEMFKKAQELQKVMLEQRAALANKEWEGSAGGDMVYVRMTGKFEVKQVRIDETLLKTADKEMLEDLLVSAVNNVIKKIQEETQKGYGDLLGEAGLPPNFLGM